MIHANPEPDDPRPPARPARRSPSSLLFSPVLGTLTANARTSLAFGLIGVAQITAALLGLPLFPCPMLHATGIPCPGCGASRACAALVRGQWFKSVKYHAFAPLFLLAVAIFLLCGAAPRKMRTAMSRAVAAVERTTGLTVLLVTAAIIYWLARLSYDFHGFAHLMGGAGS